MPDQTTPLGTPPTVTKTPLDGGMQYVESRATALIGGMQTGITVSAFVRADVELQPRLADVDGIVVFELVDAAGNIIARNMWSDVRPAEPEPWPRTQMVAPHVWTELPGGAGTVLNESDATATVTVHEDGEVVFGAPMRWRPADAQEEYDDGWSEDV